MTQPRIAVIVFPVHGAAGLAVTLAGLLAQTRRDFEVVMVDPTPEVLRSGECSALIRILRACGIPVSSSIVGSQHVIERILLLSPAPFILFVDGTLYLTPPAIDRMATALESGTARAVACSVRGDQTENIMMFERSFVQEFGSEHANAVAVEAVHHLMQQMLKGAAVTQVDAAVYMV
jgi:uncharacterized Fe-S cluster-containing radical SAM superfamily protein